VFREESYSTWKRPFWLILGSLLLLLFSYFGRPVVFVCPRAGRRRPGTDTKQLVGHAIHDSPGEQRGVEHLRESSATATANGSNGAAASSSSRASGARASISGFAPPKCRNYPTRNGGYWSPCLRYHGGQWYVVVVYEREDGKSRLLITSTRDIFDTHSWTTPVEVEDLSGREPDVSCWLESQLTPAALLRCWQGVAQLYPGGIHGVRAAGVDHTDRPGYRQAFG
jgi:hypothetical protein